MNRGYIPKTESIPEPDMSFVRLFGDVETGWQYRGQYAIWTGSGVGERSRYLLLERLSNRVAAIAYPDGDPVFHEVKAGIAFLVQGMARYWLTFDSDAMWLDTPSPDGQYAFLAVGGSAGKPNRATVDWTCTRCGQGLSAREFELTPHTFKQFLAKADGYADEFNQNTSLRTCESCGTVHPPVYIGQEGAVSRASSINEG